MKMVIKRVWLECLKSFLVDAFAKAQQIKIKRHYGFRSEDKWKAPHIWFPKWSAWNKSALKVMNLLGVFSSLCNFSSFVHLWCLFMCHRGPFLLISRNGRASESKRKRKERNHCEKRENKFARAFLRFGGSLHQARIPFSIIAYCT